MTSPSFSPLFSNAAPDHEPPAAVTTPAVARQLSRPHGDHHMLFVDPVVQPRASREEEG